jgi:uncharacterized membrane protein YhaH (DUF805 family)
MADFIKTYFWDVIRFHYADFYGRASVRQFWYFALILFVLSIIFIVIPTGSIQFLVFLVLFIPSLAIVSRRLHDANLSGWFQLMYLVPCIGWIILIVLLSLPFILNLLKRKVQEPKRESQKKKRQVLEKEYEDIERQIQQLKLVRAKG